MRNYDAWLTTPPEYSDAPTCEDCWEAHQYDDEHCDCDCHYLFEYIANRDAAAEEAWWSDWQREQEDAAAWDAAYAEHMARGER